MPATKTQASAAHTAGPWFLEGNWDASADGALGGWVSHFPPAGAPLFEINPLLGEPEEIVANARLIAAGPEMLAALKALIAHLGPDGYIPGAGKPATDKARAAIARAEGR